MGDHAVAGAPYSVDEGFAVTAANPIPPQVLARWAAMASERAYFSMLPHQAEASA